MKPTLPEPDIYATSGPAHNYGIENGYTAETVQRLIDEAYAAGLEDAAKVCDEEHKRARFNRQVRPVAWRSVGGSIWGHKTSDDDEPLYGAELKRERDMLMETLRDEMSENLRLRELGGAGPDENITAMTERLIRELEAHRLYARSLKPKGEA